MVNITKIFNETLIANNKINLEIKKGDIHALVGENGAGKSTLMSILFGMYQPTSGHIEINGKPAIISSPIKANKLGIGMVHQHFKLVEINKVWENIALGDEIVYKKLFLSKKEIKQKITKIMNKYDLKVDLDAKISDISVGMQQRVEILKILYRNADILVFDEPTAVLTPNQIESLLNVMKILQKNGKTIIFITHKLDEIKKVANKATVIRGGKKVADFNVDSLKQEELAQAMVGRKLIDVKNNYKPIGKNKILSINNLSVSREGKKNKKAVNKISFDLHDGEILAIAGVEGNGQTELIEAITGLKKPISGDIFFKNENVTNFTINKRYLFGMSHIPEDRHKYGMLLDFNVSENIVMQEIDSTKFSKIGFIKNEKVKRYSQEVIENFDVRGARNGHAIARGLSGGNQQKAVIGREMTREHDLLVVVQPTRGLDVGAIEYIHKQILKEKESGKSILLVSYELNEVMALADNILVINKGEIVGSLKGKGAKKTEIGALMAGKN